MPDKYGIWHEISPSYECTNWLWGNFISDAIWLCNTQLESVMEFPPKLNYKCVNKELSDIAFNSVVIQEGGFSPPQ